MPVCVSHLCQNTDQGPSPRSSAVANSSSSRDAARAPPSRLMVFRAAVTAIQAAPCEAFPKWQEPALRGSGVAMTGVACFIHGLVALFVGAPIALLVHDACVGWKGGIDHQLVRGSCREGYEGIVARDLDPSDAPRVERELPSAPDRRWARNRTWTAKRCVDLCVVGGERPASLVTTRKGPRAGSARRFGRGDRNIPPAKKSSAWGVKRYSVDEPNRVASCRPPTSRGEGPRHDGEGEARPRRGNVRPASLASRPVERSEARRTDNEYPIQFHIHQTGGAPR